MIEIVDDLPKKHTKREAILCDLDSFIKSDSDVCKVDTSTFSSLSSARSLYSHEISTLKLPISTSKVNDVLYLIKNQDKARGKRNVASNIRSRTTD